MQLTKTVMAVFIYGFWLVLPIPLILAGVGGFETINITNNPTILNLVGIYFKTFTFSIAGINAYLRIFLNFLQFASFIAGILLLFNIGE